MATKKGTRQRPERKAPEPEVAKKKAAKPGEQPTRPRSHSKTSRRGK